MAVLRNPDWRSTLKPSNEKGIFQEQQEWDCRAWEAVPLFKATLDEREELQEQVDCGCDGEGGLYLQCACVVSFVPDGGF